MPKPSKACFSPDCLGAVENVLANEETEAPAASWGEHEERFAQ